MSERQRHIKVDTTEDASSPHLDAEKIGKFANGELAAEQNQRAQKHLAHCDHCRRDLVALIRRAAVEVTEEERKLLQALPPLESGAQILQTLARFPNLPAEQAENGSFVSRWWEQLAACLPQPLLAPALATAVFAFLALGSLGGYQLYVRLQTDSEIARGYQTLKQNWKVSENDFRPPGEFELSALSRPHGPAPAADPAEQAFRSALRRDADNREALLGLAVYDAFAGKTGRADSLLRVLLQRDSTDAEAWNQRGVVWARLEQNNDALAAFAAALRHRPSYNEAAFNRALLLTRVRRRDEAMAAWQDYVRRDPASVWSEAARAHLRKLAQP